jgi:hypothetical protein
VPQYDEQYVLAQQQLAKQHPDASRLDLDTALVMTWIDGIEIEEWVARA